MDRPKSKPEPFLPLPGHGSDQVPSKEERPITTPSVDQLNTDTRPEDVPEVTGLPTSSEEAADNIAQPETIAQRVEIIDANGSVIQEAMVHLPIELTRNNTVRERIRLKTRGPRRAEWVAHLRRKRKLLNLAKNTEVDLGSSDEEESLMTADDRSSQEENERFLKSLLPTFLEIARAGLLIPVSQELSPSELRLKKAIARAGGDSQKGSIKPV